MSYIDVTYYNDTYMGEPADSTADLNKFIRRATDLIDQVTNYQILSTGFDNLPSFVQDQIKKATAAQTEYMVLHGGSADLDAGLSGDLNSVRIGSFSYGGGSTTAQTGSSRNIDRVSPTTLEYLKPTGLLYQGISARRNGGCFNGC